MRPRVKLLFAKVQKAVFLFVLTVYHRCGPVKSILIHVFPFNFSEICILQFVVQLILFLVSNSKFPSMFPHRGNCRALHHLLVFPHQFSCLSCFSYCPSCLPYFLVLPLSRPPCPSAHYYNTHEWLKRHPKFWTDTLMNL